jgi:predicted AlkP superfamily phosphohydrolase/phosphomutase
MAMTSLRRSLLSIALVASMAAGIACDRSKRETPLRTVDISEREIPPPTGDRVVLIGIDAATWDVIRPLLAKGDLPNLRGLIDRGWSGVLTSMEPMVSPALWTTIASGRLPKDHGIEGFLAPTKDGGKSPVTTNLRNVETLWTMATRSGRTVDVIGWFVTWPAEPINGIMVCDRFGPQREGDVFTGGASSFTVEHPGVTPASFVDTATSLIVRPDDFLLPAERKHHEQYLIYPVDATRTAIAEHVLQEKPADLTMIYLWGVDPTQHWFWKYHDPSHWPGPPIPDSEKMSGDPVADYYRDTDQFLGRILARLRPTDTVIVVSDHGAGPVTKYDPKKPYLSGDHRMEGIIIAAGPPIRHGTAAKPPGLLDVTPTVLYLLGLPAGRDMPGGVITDMLTPAWMQTHPERRIPTWEQGARAADRWPIPFNGDDQIRQKLRSLGYID